MIDEMLRIKGFTFTLLFVFFGVLFFHGVDGATPEERAAELLSQMTLDEKLSLVHGVSGPYVGNVPANTRLNIPPLHLEDGPQGVADGVQKTTCWPSALTVVATWDLDLMYVYSKSMAKEQKMKGTNVMLAPMINIARVPVGGRNFESFGEDPFLTSAMVVPSVKGIQSEGVMACAKHFVNNNQEYNRTTVSANVDERTQWEIYYPHFLAAVEAGVVSFMCSYNKIGDVWACENNATLNGDLKGKMAYKYFVMSDWGATHSTVLAANSGLDMEMPDSTYFGDALLQAVQQGQVSQSRIDDMAYRILLAMFTVGIFDNPPSGDLNVDSQSEEHTRLARQLAAEGTVLLKNEENILPLSHSTVTRIAVIGDDGHDAPIYAGFGSGYVVPPYVVTPLEGIQQRSKAGTLVTYANSSQLETAVVHAKSADVAIVFVGTISSEGWDRESLSLGEEQDNLVATIAQAQPNTIVVVHTPGAVLMPWIDNVKATLCAFMPGQEDGHAIASVLFGDVNPSGKLPLTFPVDDKQVPANTPLQYPGEDNESMYSEKLLVGYRWYDANNEEPLFPFGFGLSYTTFTYSNLIITQNNLLQTARISVDIGNDGLVLGAEVVQLYLGFPSKTAEPPKILKGFHKVELIPGSTKTVTFNLLRRDLSIWDTTTHDWKVEHGEYRVFIGSSSRNIHLVDSFAL